MLDTHCQRKREAEDLYRRALGVEPNHSYALYNLAVLLEDKNTSLTAEFKKIQATSQDLAQEEMEKLAREELGRRDEVCELYRRAVEADPRDGTTVADYGRCMPIIFSCFFFLSA